MQHTTSLSDNTIEDLKFMPFIKLFCSDMGIAITSGNPLILKAFYLQQLCQSAGKWSRHITIILCRAEYSTNSDG